MVSMTMKIKLKMRIMMIVRINNSEDNVDGER